MKHGGSFLSSRVKRAFPRTPSGLALCVRLGLNSNNLRDPGLRHRKSPEIWESSLAIPLLTLSSQVRKSDQDFIQYPTDVHTISSCPLPLKVLVALLLMLQSQDSPAFRTKGLGLVWILKVSAVDGELAHHTLLLTSICFCVRHSLINCVPFSLLL